LLRLLLRELLFFRKIASFRLLTILNTRLERFLSFFFPSELELPELELSSLSLLSLFFDFLDFFFFDFPLIAFLRPSISPLSLVFASPLA